jgi:hypothetical protein
MMDESLNKYAEEIEEGYAVDHRNTIYMLVISTQIQPRQHHGDTASFLFTLAFNSANDDDDDDDNSSLMSSSSSSSGLQSTLHSASISDSKSSLVDDTLDHPSSFHDDNLSSVSKWSGDSTRFLRSTNSLSNILFCQQTIKCDVIISTFYHWSLCQTLILIGTPCK